ncbi:MAG: ATP-binding protein [Thermodesulfobacteriota bacterium]|nr:ATP-binding protein [Thermodesulfobacteriota bacterium]
MSKEFKKIPFSIGIVGCGRACKFFLNLLETSDFPFLDIKVEGVCDINPDAKGMVKAREMGIATFDNLQDFFKFRPFDAVIELTNNKILTELMTMRPDNVGVIEHNVGRLLRNLFITNQDLARTKKQATLDRGYYNIFFQQTNLGVVILDTEFNIVDANPVYLKAVKKSKPEVLEKKCYEIVKGFYAPCPSTDAGFECPFIKTMNTGKPAHVIHEHTSTDGRISYFNLSTYPVRDINNEIINIIEFWQNITSEISQKWENKVKRIHSDMKKVIQEDRLVALGKLVASSVHEINNPIQGLLTFSYIIEDMLKNDPLTKEDLKQLRDFNSLMKKELERCGKIVSGLLAFSRESALEFMNIDINEILEAIISLTGHKLELSAIVLETPLNETPLIVHGDKDQLQQCFLNLIFNAIDAMPRGGKLTIQSGLSNDENNVWIKIKDNGCGIDDDVLEHIFDPFFTTKEEKGTGLGLSIVYGIVKEHNGNINVNSSPGNGTEFIISFPAV